MSFSSKINYDDDEDTRLPENVAATREDARVVSCRETPVAMIIVSRRIVAGYDPREEEDTAQSSQHPCPRISRENTPGICALNRRDIARGTLSAECFGSLSMTWREIARSKKNTRSSAKYVRRARKSILFPSARKRENFPVSGKR